MLHQGDDNRHIVNHIRIETAYLDFTSLLQAQKSHGFSRYEQKRPGFESSARTKYTRAITRLGTEAIGNVGSTGADTQHLEPTCKKSLLQEQMREHVSRSRSAANENKLVVSQQSIWSLYEWVCRLISRSSHTSFVLLLFPKHDQFDYEVRAKTIENYGRLIQFQKVSSANHVYLMLCAGALSCLFGRHISMHDLLGLLSHCREDQLLLVLTFMIGFGLCQYLMISISQLPPAVPFLTLEDKNTSHPSPISLHDPEDTLRYEVVDPVHGLEKKLIEQYQHEAAGLENLNIRIVAHPESGASTRGGRQRMTRTKFMAWAIMDFNCPGSLKFKQGEFIRVDTSFDKLLWLGSRDELAGVFPAMCCTLLELTNWPASDDSSDSDLERNWRAVRAYRQKPYQARSDRRQPRRNIEGIEYELKTTTYGINTKDGMVRVNIAEADSSTTTTSNSTPTPEPAISEVERVRRSLPLTQPDEDEQCLKFVWPRRTQYERNTPILRYLSTIQSDEKFEILDSSGPARVEMGLHNNSSVMVGALSWALKQFYSDSEL